MKQRMHEQLSVATVVLLSTNEFFEKKKQGTHKDVAVNGSAKRQNRSNSDGKQTIPNTNPYDELVEEIKDKLGNAATAAQLKGLLSTSTLHSKDVMNALFEALFDEQCCGVYHGDEQHQLYNGDVLEEETILQWYYVAVAGGKNSEILQNAKRFLEGLQSADYESEQE
ncbi:unnamed protein product [Miscanthus lutarioriparius]|uniref:W2 domain-containing protein n=1 Tax=Miscanthus lutarioriparius TaxID=422564 RepID=A0A811RCW5_9POAL|nr:unnamed protein product [Miscanthus lutarioriparius]